MPRTKLQNLRNGQQLRQAAVATLRSAYSKRPCSIAPGDRDGIGDARTTFSVQPTTKEECPAFKTLSEPQSSWELVMLWRRVPSE